MPYIKQEDRDGLNDDIIILGDHINSEGELNYAITMLVRDFITKEGGNYAAHNVAIGVLECAKLELYRRLTAPYEDKKIIENGDLDG